MVTTVTITDAFAELTFTSFEFAAPHIWELTFDYFSAASSSNQTAEIELFTDAGVTDVASPSDTIAEIVLKDRADGTGQAMVTISGLSLPYATLASALGGGGNSITNYFGIVALLNGDVLINGSDNSDLYLEVGTGGTATVNGGAGADILHVWQSKNVSFDGGTGSDTLSFQSYAGGPYPSEPPVGAAVNLATGSGTNAFGGTLTLTNVENVIGTDKANSFTGNGSSNTFGDGIYDVGADTINGGAGNDWVNLAEQNGGGVRDGGGAGNDTLAINFAEIVVGLQKLDLLNQALNSGVFHSDVFTNFENFVHGKGFFVATGQTFTFVDDNGSHTVEAMGESNHLILGGGNDTAIIYKTVSNYSVAADGGAGVNTLNLGSFLLGGANIFDAIHQANNSGIFAHGTYAHFTVFTGGGVVSAPTGAAFVFRGSNANEKVTGTYLDDTLGGGGGNDTLNGGPGNDRLIGGPGRDTFIFNSSLLPIRHTDTIVGFSPPADTIDLDNAVFTGIGGNGVLAAARFHVGAHAQHPGDRIIYNPNTGALLYDSNGTGLGHETEFAILGKHLALTHADFIVI